MTVWMVNENTFSDEFADELVEKYDADSIEDVVASMEEDVKTILRERVFADSDDIKFLEVDSEVSDE